MKYNYSRRAFLAKETVAMGAALLCEMAGGVSGMSVVEA